jgi:hypothetical protein
MCTYVWSRTLISAAEHSYCDRRHNTQSQPRTITDRPYLANFTQCLHKFLWAYSEVSQWLVCT